MLLRWLAAATLAITTTAAATSPLPARLQAMTEQGSGEAAYHFGMLYHLGTAGVAKDTRKAAALFKLSTERGDPLGAYKYGCYFAGQGDGAVQPDAKLALKYKLVAAQAGYALAQQDVGKHLIIDGDAIEALRWLEASAAQGNADAMMILGLVYTEAMPEGAPKLPKDVARGYAFFRLATRHAPELATGIERDMAETLSAADKARADAIVASWKARPTALTLKAQAGLDAAERLAPPHKPNG